ncbi:MAG: hypothetical protein ACI4QN_01395 [Candidatus Coproplasma sp.]
MSEALIYVSAFAFALYIFPVHVYSYVYLTTQKGYASVSVSLFRLIPLYKGVNELKLDEKSLVDSANDGGGKLKYPRHYVDLYNKLCITKIVQVSDFGVQNQSNAYAALAQHAFTQALYSFVRINGGRTKLRNYVVINGEHGYVNYCLKLVGVINLMGLIRLIILYFWSVLNERKD